MSFNSAEWTIPELCVWIVTHDKSALNRLVGPARISLRAADLVHSGAYAARDEVLAAAQQGRITITCLRKPNYGIDPPGTFDSRAELTPAFWKAAELKDAISRLDPSVGWCIARRVSAPAGATEYGDLLVSRDKVLLEWPPRTDAVLKLWPEMPAPSAHAPAVAARAVKPTVEAVMEWYRQEYVPEWERRRERPEKLAECGAA